MGGPAVQRGKGWNPHKGHVFSFAAISLEYHTYMESHPVPLERGSVVGRAVLEGKALHVRMCRPTEIGLNCSESGGHAPSLGLTAAPAS
jgi:hypothetical protein